MATATPIARWRFDEPATSVLPVDELGSVLPLQKASGKAMPTVTAGRLAGPARDFTGRGAGMAARCAEPNALALTRSVTVEALVKYVRSGFYETVIAHGRDTSAAERRSWWMLVGYDGVSSDVLRFAWTRTAGAAAIAIDLPFVAPSDGWMHVVAVREWTSATSVAVHWYINGAYVGSASSTDGDIDDATDGEVMVGACYSGGVYGSAWGGLIDSIAVYDGVMSAEEVRQRYNALFVYPDQAYELLRALQPPGQAWTRRLDSNIQRLFLNAATALAGAWSKAAELLEDFLPDRAWSFLDRWESVTRLSPGPLDTIAQRRDRVVAFLRKVHGYSRGEILNALVGPLGLAASSLEIVENSNQRTDTFASLASYWTSEPRAGTAGVAGGKLDLDAGIGVDVRWDAANDKAARVRASLANGLGAELVAAIQYSALPASCWVGMCLVNLAAGTAEIYGLYNQAGTVKFWHRRIEGGAVTDTFSAGAVPAGTTYWLRYHDDEATAAVEYRVDGSGYDGPWSTAFAAVTPLADGKQWFGFCVGSDLASTVSAISADVLEYRVWCPEWDGVFDWMIYRNPALAPTSYDRVGAQLVVDRMKPAHTNGVVIESKAAVAGSPYSRVGGVPVGV